MRDTGIHEVRRNLAVRQGDGNSEAQIPWLTHLKPNEFLFKRRADYSRRGFKRQLRPGPRHSARITGETAGSVPAHFGLAAVSVIIAHPKISPIRGALQHQHAISAHAPMTIANLRDLIGRQLQIAQPVVDHDEIVPRAVHFTETQHASVVTTIFRQSQGTVVWPAKSLA